MNFLSWGILGFTAFMSIIDFVLMGRDKWQAVRHNWRIPEATLLGFARCFGAIGGYLGMKIFHHKTRHKRFAIGMPVMMVLQIALIAIYFAKFA